MIGLGTWGTSIKPVEAISLSLTPTKQEVAIGEALLLDVAIVDLGSFSTPSVSTFDFHLSFDSNVLEFTELTFGDPLLGDQIDLSGDARLFTEQGIFDAIGFSETSNGVVNFFEESFDLPQVLDTLQPVTFTLATLNFTALTPGDSNFAVTVNALGDSQGNPLNLDLIEIPPVTVTATTSVSVPEPMTSWLGLLSFLLVGSRKITKTNLSQPVLCNRHQRRC
ncbi:hypothetical protein D0962_28215 [Leptolyngbyaceae cyanobacterium CCMR0082]|uniref:Cohesin domain-containing protein n=1 Tax=Adonisia turfae CCMR0082 TaxID=2304604 RepID=A0A6M0SF28_9CYAN|nr:hypothetical protein [Adonisia turfae CCMR0082]